MRYKLDTKVLPMVGVGNLLHTKTFQNHALTGDTLFTLYFHTDNI